VAPFLVYPGVVRPCETTTACADDGGVGVGGARRRRRRRGRRSSLRRSCAQLLCGTGRFSSLAARVPPLRTPTMPLRPHGSSAHTRRKETERYRKGRAGTDGYCGPGKRADKAMCVFFFLKRKIVLTEIK
jgi:hypothetical protein